MIKEIKDPWSQYTFTFYAEKQRTDMSFLFWKISENDKISHKKIFSTGELWFMLKKHPELG
jgi:hypothetical protein